MFFLTLDEMADLLSGNRQAISEVPARREMYQRTCSLPSYPPIIYGRFDPLA